MCGKMNKKGYLRILEAVIATVIIFSLILVLLPKNENKNNMPVALDSNIESILNVAQTDPQIRTCLLAGDIIVLNNLCSSKFLDKCDEYLAVEDKSLVTDLNCFSSLISNSFSSATIWTFAFEICNRDDPICKFYVEEITEEITDKTIFESHLPKDRDIFTRGVSISDVEDLSEIKVETTNPNEQIKQKDIRIFLWLK